MTEQEIIKGLQNQQESAFKELVQNYQKQVINTCYGIVHDRDDAEDVAQEVFIEVFRSVDYFRAESKISTWLYRIAVNRSLNFIRDNNKRKWFQSIDDSEQNKNNELRSLSSSKSDTPEYELEKNERAAMLHKAIDGLPKNQKTAFTLSKYEDLSYQEISEVMNLSISSVESLLFRAKKNLQKKLYKCYQKKCI